MNDYYYERVKKIETDLRQFKANQTYSLDQIKIHKYDYVSPLKNNYVFLKYRFVPYVQTNPCLITIEYQTLDANGEIDNSYEIAIDTKLEKLRKDENGFYYENDLLFSRLNLGPTRIRMIIYSTSQGELLVWTK